MPDVMKTDAVELTVDVHGKVTINGWATTDALEDILSTVTEETS
jgi:hypothetical protein